MASYGRDSLTVVWATRPELRGCMRKKSLHTKKTNCFLPGIGRGSRVVVLVFSSTCDNFCVYCSEMKKQESLFHRLFHGNSSKPQNPPPPAPPPPAPEVPAAAAAPSAPKPPCSQFVGSIYQRPGAKCYNCGVERRNHRRKG